MYVVVGVIEIAVEQINSLSIINSSYPNVAKPTNDR